MFNQEDMEVLPINTKVLPQGRSLINKKIIPRSKGLVRKRYFFCQVVKVPLNDAGLTKKKQKFC
jgi:hypothetical protein